MFCGIPPRISATSRLFNQLANFAQYLALTVLILQNFFTVQYYSVQYCVYCLVNG